MIRLPLLFLGLALCLFQFCHAQLQYEFDTVLRYDTVYPDTEASTETVILLANSGDNSIIARVYTSDQESNRLEFRDNNLLTATATVSKFIYSSGVDIVVKCEDVKKWEPYFKDRPMDYNHFVTDTVLNAKRVKKITILNTNEGDTSFAKKIYVFDYNYPDHLPPFLSPDTYEYWFETRFTDSGLVLSKTELDKNAAIKSRFALAEVKQVKRKLVIPKKCQI